MAIRVTHVTDEFVDDRGGIARVVDQDGFVFRVVLRITSKAGTVRSNHYHKRDSHCLYVESGKCEYSEKPANDPKAKIEMVVLGPGDLVYTGPDIVHAVKFLEDTVLYAFTTEKRKQDAYEEDTMRVTIVP